MRKKSKQKSSDGSVLSQVTKAPPHSIEAEQAVLGGLMLDNQAWDKIADRLSEADFYRVDHQKIFRAIVDLASRSHPFDVLTLAENLKTTDSLDEAGGDSYLFELAKNTPSASNVIAYADIVRERSILRQLIGVAQTIAEDAFDPQGQTSREVLDQAEQKVFAIAEQTSRNQQVASIKTLLAKALDRIDTLYHSGTGMTGLSTGFQDFDQMTSGLQAADLVIIAGRPSMGKTAFAMNIAEHIAIQENKTVLVFSMEMPGESLATRMMSSLGRINQLNVRSGKLSAEDWPRINHAIERLSQAPLLIDDSASLSPAELRARARRVTRERGPLGLVIVDYLQLMHVHGTSENRAVEVSEISRNLKALAKELNVPVIALSQLNRGLEQRTDKRPIMSDLRDSGSIEQDADLIVFIYRDEVYRENNPETKGKAEIIIGKQRNGPIGKIMLTFLGQYTRFENFMPTEVVYRIPPKVVQTEI